MLLVISIVIEQVEKLEENKINITWGNYSIGSAEFEMLLCRNDSNKMHIGWLNDEVKIINCIVFEVRWCEFLLY